MMILSIIFLINPFIFFHFYKNIVKNHRFPKALDDILKWHEFQFTVIKELGNQKILS